MNRRAFVSAIGMAAGTGCLSLPTAADGGVGRRVVETGGTSVHDDPDLSVSVSVPQKVISPDRLPRIEFTVTWKSDESETFQFGNAVPISQPQYSTEPNGLVLFPSARDVERRDEDTWVPVEGEMGAPAHMITKELAPGESLSREWTIWADPKHASHIEPGEYRFDGKVGRISGDAIPWELTLEVVERTETPE